MDDYALVLNAGSSSLKFCVYRRRPDGDPWRLEARGQIDGIGTSPRFSVKGDAGERLIDTQLDAERARRRAPRSTRSPRWLRERYGGARVLGVGHRVVHGGPRFAGPTIVTPAGPRRAARADAARAAASAAQPGGHRRGDRAAARRAAGRLLRHQLPSRPAGRRRARAAAARHLSATACSATASTACRTSTSRRCCRTRRPEIAGGRVIVAHLGSGASLCALKNGKSVDSTLGFTALDGLCMGTRPGALDPGVVLYLFQGLGPVRRRRSRRSSTRSRACSASPASATTCATCSATREPEAQAGGRLLRLSRGQGDRRARRGARRHRRPGVHRRHRRELAPRSAGASARRRPGSASSSTPTRTPATRPRISAAGSRGVGLGDPDQRRTDDRPPHRPAAGTGRSPRLARGQ